MMNEGSSSTSISATSGAPEPAFMALFSSVYSAPPAPGSSSVTQMFGWVLLNSVTARFIPGTQAQNVIGVADELQDLPPASTVADALALALALVVDPLAAVVLLLPLLLHAARSERGGPPATAADTRAGPRASTWNRFLDDIVARLLCSVLPYLSAVAAVPPVVAACGGDDLPAPTCWSS